jgi:hypothetical protein
MCADFEFQIGKDITVEYFAESNAVNRAEGGASILSLERAITDTWSMSNIPLSLFPDLFHPGKPQTGTALGAIHRKRDI